MPLNYIGNGHALRGIPARDLSDAETIWYGEKKLVQSGLYQKPKKEKQAKESQEEKQVKEGEL